MSECISRSRFVKKSTRCERLPDAKEFAKNWYEERVLERRNHKVIEKPSFAAFVEEELQGREDEKIAMYCTGGIRCERWTAYLKGKGFKNVYHPKGGILRYLEEMPKEKSLWEGDCFVFDYRVAVDHDLQPGMWKIDPETSDPVPMSPEEQEKIAGRRRSGAIFKKPYTI